MDQFFVWIKAFLGWFPSPVKTMICLIVLAGIALFLPTRWEQSMGIEAWNHEHQVVEWGIFLFCTLFLALSVVEDIGKRIGRRRRLWRLSNDEQQVLARFLATNSCTQDFMAGDMGVNSLLADGVLTRAQDAYDFFKDRGLFHYSITPKTLRYLVKHSKSIPKKLPE